MAYDLQSVTKGNCPVAAAQISIMKISHEQSTAEMSLSSSLYIRSDCSQMFYQMRDFLSL